MKFFIFLLCIMLLGACKNDGIPDGILPQEKMESVLWDLIKADQVMNIQYNGDTTVSHTRKSVQMYAQVLSIHKVSEADFKKSFHFYQTHPDALKPVLDSMRNRSAKLPPQLSDGQ